MAEIDNENTPLEPLRDAMRGEANDCGERLRHMALEAGLAEKAAYRLAAEILEEEEDDARAVAAQGEPNAGGIDEEWKDPEQEKKTVRSALVDEGEMQQMITLASECGELVDNLGGVHQSGADGEEVEVRSYYEGVEAALNWVLGCGPVPVEAGEKDGFVS